MYAEPSHESSVANLAQVSLATDNVVGDDGGRSQLATVTGNVRDGYAVSLTLGDRRQDHARARGSAGTPWPAR